MRLLFLITTVISLGWCHHSHEQHHAAYRAYYNDHSGEVSSYEARAGFDQRRAPEPNLKVERYGLPEPGPYGVLPEPEPFALPESEYYGHPEPEPYGLHKLAQYGLHEPEPYGLHEPEPYGLPAAEEYEHPEPEPYGLSEPELYGLHEPEEYDAPGHRRYGKAYEESDTAELRKRRRKSIQRKWVKIVKQRETPVDSDENNRSEQNEDPERDNSIGVEPEDEDASDRQRWSPSVQNQFDKLASYQSAPSSIANFTCSSSIRYDRKVKFLLYKQKSQRPVKLTIENIRNLRKEKFVFIIHGWLASPDSAGIVALKTAYLSEHRSNVIVIDWSKLSQSRFPLIYCYVPKIAEYIETALRAVSLSYVHLVGHGVGAHIAGFVGKIAQKTGNKKISRITGLDPAGPGYQFTVAALHLSASDADLVEVVHSNAGILGFHGTSGTVDYHLNCGSFQPGCDSASGDNNQSAVANLQCDHDRAQFVWAESVNSEDLIPQPCLRCPGTTLGTCKSSRRYSSGRAVSMGNPNPPYNNYNVLTCSSPPYGRPLYLVDHVCF